MSILLKLLLGTALILCQATLIASDISRIEDLVEIAATFESDRSFSAWLLAQREIQQRSRAPSSEHDSEDILENKNLLHHVYEAVELKRQNIGIQKTNPTSEFNVRDYGAKGDGLENDAPAIRRAIEDARNHPNSRVYLPSGTYLLGDLDPETRRAPSPYFDACEPAAGITPSDLGSINPPASLFINQAANMVIAGDGPEQTKLVLGIPWESAIIVQHSQNISIQDLSLDYAKLPFTQGKVIAVHDNKTYDVEVDEHYPSPLENHIRKARFGMVTRNFVRSAEGIVPLPARSAPSYFTLSDIKQLTEKTYRFTIGSSGIHASSAARANELPENALFVLYGRISNENSVIKLDAVKNVTLSHLDIYSSFASGILVKRSGFVDVGSCRIIPKPGTSRISSTNADGVFGQSNYVSPYVHNCFMTLVGDDFVNTHSNALQISDYDGHTFHGRANGHSNFMPGQRLIVVETGSWKSKYAGIIKKSHVSKTAGQLMLSLEMNTPIPVGIYSLKNQETATGKDKKRPDRLLNLDLTGPGAVVMNNEFTYGFRLILRSSNALVAQNLLLNRHNPGNFIILGTHALEAWKANNITIRNNTIDGLGNVMFAPQAPVPNRNILIADNVFLNPEINSDTQVFPAKIFSRELNQDVELRGNVYRSTKE